MSTMGDLYASHNQSDRIVDFGHLDALNLRLSHERERWRLAKSVAERNMRSVWVAQLEKEITHERVFLGLTAQPEIESINDDDLLAALELNP